MSGIKDHERESIRVCLENHQVLLVRGSEWTGVIRATEAVLELIPQADGDTEDREMAWGRTHPDLMIYDGRELNVEEARQIRRDATSMPVRWSRRFVIISHIDRPHFVVMPTLLKLVEEPPDHFSVIMTVSSEHRVMPTILSRSLRVNVVPSDEEEVKWWLDSKGKEPDDLRIKASGGDLDVAENLDLELLRIWQRDWASVFMGTDFHGSFPTVWSTRLESASESTQFACWNLLTHMTSQALHRNRAWVEFGLVCLKAKEVVQTGLMNKMMSSTLLLKVYAIAKTIIVRIS